MSLDSLNALPKPYRVASWRRFCTRPGYIAALVLLFLSVYSSALCAQTRPDFSGVWQRDPVRSLPVRTEDVTLRIVHRDATLSVETTIVRPGRATQHALQRYTTDGKPSTSTGADGDSFVTRIVWSEGSLLLSIVEHEDGRTIESSETWSITDQGGTLTRVRRSSKGGQQTIVYRRQR